MAGLERLVQTNELRTTLIAQLAREDQIKPRVLYDENFDALILLFADVEGMRVVHYTEDDIALLYRMNDLEVIGIQIEAFKRKFLPSHELVQRFWKLSETGVKLSGANDVMIAFGTPQHKLVREVVNAAKESVWESSKELANALAIFA
jgi:hypothetical protein